jgi:hypothetical protein
LPVKRSHASGYRKILSEEIKKLRLPATAYFNRRHAAQAAEAAPSAVRPDSRRVRADLEIRRLLLILRLLLGTTLGAAHRDANLHRQASGRNQ